MTFLALLLCFLGALPALAQVTITRMSHDDNVFYFDPPPSGAGLDAMYVAYKITNTSGADYTDLQVELKSFVGTDIVIDPQEVNPRNIGALADGASTTVFFFLNTPATGTTTTAQSHTVEVTDLTGPTVVGTFVSSFTGVTSTLKASANKVDSVAISPNPVFINSIVTITVYGHTGSSGNNCGNDNNCLLSFTPAGFSTWPVDALRLVSTSITFTSGSLGTPPTTITNDLYHMDTVDIDDSDYTATYKFLATGTTSGPVSVSPVGYISSGNQRKHTDTGNFGTFETVEEPVEITVKKEVAHEPSGSPFEDDALALDSPTDVDVATPSTLVLTYRITLEAKKGISGTPTAATVPKLVDTMPNPTDGKSSGIVTYVDPSVDPTTGEPGEPDTISSPTLTWIGVDIPASGMLTFTFKGTLPNNLPGTNPIFDNLIEAKDGDDTVLDSDTAEVLILGQLPVELTSFDAVLDGSSVNLTWATASETNNAGFEIQIQNAKSESRDASWEVLDFVPGAGTTLEAQAYGYRIEALEPGRHAFRLKQLDYDGAFEYSPEVEIVVEMAERFLVEPAYPNPFNPEAQFRFAVRQEQAVRVDLFDMLGRRVAVLYEGTPPSGQMQTVRIDGSDLSSGLYVVRVTGATFVETQRVTLVK